MLAALVQGPAVLYTEGHRSNKSRQCIIHEHNKGAEFQKTLIAVPTA